MHVEQLIALWVTICQRQRIGIKSRDQMGLTTKYVNHQLTEQQRQQLAEVLERWAGDLFRKRYEDLTPRIITQCFNMEQKQKAA